VSGLFTVFNPRDNQEYWIVTLGINWQNTKRPQGLSSESRLRFHQERLMRCVLLIACIGFCLRAASGAEPGFTDNPYSRWTRGPATNSGFFPLAVWLQSPAKAEQYKKAGINTYVGLWRGPTEEQLATLRKAGMKVICRQNDLALRRLDDTAIIGWMHNDEPDNAQSLGKDQGYGPPIPPVKILSDYEKIRAADPSRPVFLNLGQGVAWDQYIGRGVRRNHPEDYPEYIQGCDIVSFDIYPAVHENPEVTGKLWYVARGVERLVNWSGGKKVVWNCLECTRIENPDKKPTPQQVRTEAWMALIHGSSGLIYFVHQFKPTFREAALLDDPEMLAAVTALNRQITGLAPVLNSATVSGEATVKSQNQDVPVAFMLKRHRGSTYLFAVAMRDGTTRASFKLKTLNGEKTVNVLNENRTIVAKDGTFTDDFAPRDVHLYHIEAGDAQ
jgi:hypothetical protein